MPIVYETGDLLESDCDMIAHGCNCHCRMKSGIAAQIAKKYPEVPKSDKRTEYGDRSKMGMAMPVFHPDMDKCVVNLYTQYRYGENSKDIDYDAIRSSMEVLRSWHEQCLKHNAKHKLGIPPIGTDTASSNWQAIEKIINEVFDDIDIYVYSLDSLVIPSLEL
jgi:O-acetyl-ADP-ribose deacetylase (regulator of RNase III)